MKILQLTFLLLFAFSTFSYHQVNAQPATYGCHFAHTQFKAPPLTEADKQARRASAERSDTIDIIHYDIDLDVTRFSQSILYGTCAVSFRAKMENINSINLDLLDLFIDSIESDAGNLNFTRSGFNVHVEWPETMIVSDTNTLTVHYRGNPTVSGGSFGGFYFEGGYAYNLGIDLIGNPHNFGRSWFPCFDNFVERATYEISMMTNGGRKGYAVGDFISEEVVSGDTIVRSYHMQKQLPTYLVGVAISNYAEDNSIHSGAYGDIPVQIVAKPGDMADARNSLAFLPDAIDCLEYWYGPYVWNRVGYAMTLRGAMEHAGNIAYPDNSIAGGLLSTRLMTHELCHHWWGNLITVNYAPDMWIKEGNAEYGAHLIEEFIGGAESFRKVVRDNHKFVYLTAHVVDGEYLALSPLSQENTYGRHTYYRGASVMHNMRAYLGDSLFRAGQQTLLNENAYSYLNAQSYRDAMTAATGVDMNPFFDDWIFAPGYADYYVHHFSQDSAGLLHIALGQNQYQSNHYHRDCPVPISVYYADGSHENRRVMISGPLDSVTLNTDGTLPIGVTVNTGHIMNLAMFEDAIHVTDVGDFKDSEANYKLNVDVLNDTFRMVFENHLTAPDGLYDEDLYRLSNSHFWHIVGNHEDQFEGNLLLYYDDNDNLAPDIDLTAMSEDSIVLMYRADATEAWQEYEFYAINKLIPTDGKGTMILSKALNGDYTFANRLDGKTLVATNEIRSDIHIELYPNPASESITIHSGEIKFDLLQIFSIDGQFISEIKNPKSTEFIRVSEYASGEYIVSLFGIDGDSGAHASATFTVK
jgi:aminopeptidase N